MSTLTIGVRVRAGFGLDAKLGGDIYGRVERLFKHCVWVRMDSGRRVSLHQRDVMPCTYFVRPADGRIAIMLGA